MWQEVIHFWFEELDSAQWWKLDPVLDNSIKQRFEYTLQQAIAGELYVWRENAQGRLAEIIVLDQFSRNIFRGSERAFAQDSLALKLSQEAVAKNVLEELSPIENAFLLMPYMHSESRLIHEQAASLFKSYTPESNYEFEMKHKKIIDEFGRYPHRNIIMGRLSTEAETIFLQQPDSGF